MEGAELYFKRYSAGYPPLVNPPPRQETRLIIALPAYADPEVTTAVQSLIACAKPDYPCELIILLNHPESDQTAAQTNADLLTQILKIISRGKNLPLQIYPLVVPLPDKHAGVGLARKIAMDEAARRFDLIDQPEGIIACFDADCTCDPNYLSEMIRHFDQWDTGACSIFYQHREEIHQQEIIAYELHLRYYMHCLRWAGYPFAYQTLGSSMAVRADHYIKAGGMNRRKAAEDFYFLNKLIPYRNFSECHNTTIYPSPRISYRVPFGTGKAIADLIESRKQPRLYNPLIFQELRNFLQLLENDYPEFPGKESNQLKRFLAQEQIRKMHQDALRNSKNRETFLSRFFSAFDGLKVLQFVHARQEKHPDVPAPDALKWLWSVAGISPSYREDLAFLLGELRKFHRSFGDRSNLYYLK